MLILHLSADYPDPLQPAKTRAVSNLLELVTDHRHAVYSLNRVSPKLSTSALDFDDKAGEGHRAVAYAAAARGWRHLSYLNRLADWIAEDVEKRGLKPDAIHAHKVSVEGIVAHRIAARLSLPFVVSVQGNTDLKIVGARPDLRRHFAAVWQGARVAFPFAPWASDGLNARLGPRAGPIVGLPCPGPGDSKIAPRVVGPQFRTAFHFRDAANKNAAGLIRAVGKARQSVPDLRLELIGGGAPEAFARMRDIAASLPAEAVSFVGPVPHEQMQTRFNASAGFAMTSLRESFGMVYSEALLAGCPCLISRGRGIDGYLESGGVVIAVDPRNEDEIAEALTHLARDEVGFKDRLATLMEAGGLDFLQREAIARTYRSGLAAALQG